MAGDAHPALADPSRVAISEDLARKYFEFGRCRRAVLEISDTWGRRVCTIQRSDQGAAREHRAEAGPGAGSIRASPRRRPTDVAQLGIDPASDLLQVRQAWSGARLRAQLPAFVDRQVGQGFGDAVVPHQIMTLKVVPLRDVHLLDPKQRAAIDALGLVGVAALALALINYVNLATARRPALRGEVAVLARASGPGRRPAPAVPRRGGRHDRPGVRGGAGDRGTGPAADQRRRRPAAHDRLPP
ncbi:hypothetical protein ACRAWD_06425 [Caulobacter segnis]